MTETLAFDIRAILPLSVVSGGAVGLLLLEALLRPRSPEGGRGAARVGAALALVSTGVLLAGITVAANAFVGGESRWFHSARPMLRLDPLASFSIVLLSVVTLGCSLLAARHLQKLRIHRGEVYGLLMLSLAGMTLLVGAADLVTVFLGIEGATLPLYVLAGLDAQRSKSSEGALKFLLLGTFASALGLFGIALLYGATGATGFAQVAAALPESGPLGLAGAGFLGAGLAFRVAAAPFHGWAADLEEGAPTPIAAFLSAGLKTAAFIALLRVLNGAFAPGDPAFLDVLRTLAILSMAVGSVMSAVQDNLKRMLAYVGVANGGFLLSAFLSAADTANAAMLFGLVALAFTNLGAFAVLTITAQADRGGERIGDFEGLAQRRPALAAAFTLFLFSLAGIPGTAGFIARLKLLSEAIQVGEVGLGFFSGAASLVLLYALLRVPVAMYMEPPPEGSSRPRVGTGEGLVLWFCAAVVLVLGIVPNGAPLIDGLAVIDWTLSAVSSR